MAVTLHVSLYVYSVSELAVVGPPNLFRVGFQTIGPLAIMTMSWTRSNNNLTRLLPICFVANTKRWVVLWWCCMKLNRVIAPMCSMRWFSIIS